MSYSEIADSYTQHAFLVAWGGFAQEIGLVQALQAVKLKQKKHDHSPQTKVIEFLVGHLAGIEHLQELSLAAHPLDKDQAVATAWGQPGWADYSGVSRTLSGLSWAEVRQLEQVLQALSQSFVVQEVKHLRSAGQRLWYDGDLTGLPVSESSTTYPNARFGHMDDDIRLGYQAALVSLNTLSYGRLWLSVAHHPGDTVSCTQAAAMAEAAEAQTGLRPYRRTELLSQRLQGFQGQMAITENRQQKQQKALSLAQNRLADLQAQERLSQQELAQLEQQYQVLKRPEGRRSHLAQARKRFEASQDKRRKQETRCQAAQKRLTKTQAQGQQQTTELNRLRQRLAQFEQDNATNPEPIEAVFRLDAGFGTYENVSLLIEMGYEVYTKPHSHQVVKHLKNKVTDQTTFSRVGANAEMLAWPNFQLKGCPYPLDVALERFYTGKTLKHSGLFHFGSDPVTQDLTAWFNTYNGRQTIEAGIKEGKQVFHLHRIKVRSEPAISLQQHFVIFAANFIRWATHWLRQHARLLDNSLDVASLGVKKQVRVAAHVSAQVVWEADGWLLKFSDYSAFAGKVLKLPASLSQPPQLACKNALSIPFFIESHLIAQPLG